MIFIKYNNKHVTKIINIDENYNFIRAEITIGKSTFGITSIYKPPPFNLNVFNLKLQNYIVEHCNCATEMLTGDININLLENTESKNEYVNILSQYGFTSIFIKGKLPSHHVTAAVLQSKITDHCPIILQTNLNFMPLIKSANNFKNHNYLKAVLNYDKLKHNLNSVNWDVLKYLDIHSVLEYFFNRLKNETNAASKIVKISNNFKKRKPWITAGILKSIRIRVTLYKELKKDSNMQLKNIYSKYKYSIFSLIKKIKCSYFQNKIENCNFDPKEIWKTANEALNLKGANSSVSFLKQNNFIITVSKNIAEYFNEHFITSRRTTS